MLLALAGCGQSDITVLDTTSGAPAAGPGGSGPAGAGGSRPGGGQGGGGQGGSGQAGSGEQNTAGTGWMPPSQSHSLASGQHGFTCARLDSGRVKCWGNNGYGVLGLGDANHRGDEPGEMGDALPAVDLGPGERVDSLAAGGDHVCALLAGGYVKCWGANTGRLGFAGDGKPRGDDPGEMGSALPFAQLGADERVAQVVAGARATCALLTTGRVTCWGGYDAGPLISTSAKDKGEKTHHDLGTDVRVVTLSMGLFAWHACALTDHGRVKCWGGNDSGQLGLGDTEPRSDPDEMGDALPFVDLGAGVRAKAIAVDSSRSCAVTDDGRIKCWGGNGSGQLGLGDTESRGDEPGEMGDALPYVDLGVGEKARSVAVGSRHTCALLESGRLKCWGGNWFGELGLGDQETRGDGADEMGDALPTVDLGAGAQVKEVSLGSLTSCALLHDGRIKCWGANSGGHLGLGLPGHDDNGNDHNLGDEPGEMGDALPAVDLGP